jgi:ATP-binding cassette subfamily F protein uup
LNNKEQRELDGLPKAIELLEADAARIHQQMAEPTFYQQSRDKIATKQSELKTIGDKLAAAYARWEELEQAVASA